MFDPSLLPHSGEKVGLRFVSNGDLYEVGVKVGIETVVEKVTLIESRERGEIPVGKKEEPCPGCREKGLLRRAASGLIGMTKVELGLDATNEIEERSRKGHCDRCKYNDWGMCTKCGCYLHAKVKISKEKCPIELW